MCSVWPSEPNVFTVIKHKIAPSNSSCCIWKLHTKDIASCSKVKFQLQFATGCILLVLVIQGCSSLEREKKTNTWGGSGRAELLKTSAGEGRSWPLDLSSRIRLVGQTTVWLISPSSPQFSTVVYCAALVSLPSSKFTFYFGSFYFAKWNIFISSSPAPLPLFHVHVITALHPFLSLILTWSPKTWAFAAFWANLIPGFWWTRDCSCSFKDFTQQATSMQLFA